MSQQVIPDRFTAEMQQPFVVFLIGMRVNQSFAVRQWSWTARQMGKMLPVLYQHPEKGFMGGETFFRLFPLTVLLVTYWRSFDDLERFARAQDDPHLDAWQQFYRRVGKGGNVGIYHETYLVEPGKYEAVYANMPLFGLAKATGQAVPVRAGHRLKARGRLTGQDVQLNPDLEFNQPD